ncbi:MAG: hypothetical protein GY842_03195, partial [bacterium]|nr:hypothetical protein [bacterium]
YHGDGSSCTPDPCEELPPIGPLCPANSIFGPGHSTNHGTAATSDQSPENGTEAIQVYENFWKLTEDITAVKFWGIELTNDPDLGFTDGCTKGRVFTYSFWKDTTYVDAEGVTRHQPDYDAGPVYKETWALTARTLITYDQWGPTIPMYEYDYTFESPVNLRGGWISVLRHYWSFAPTCWFLWANNEASLAGDDWSWQIDFGTDTVGGSSDYDMTLCLIGAAGPGPGGGPCEESCGANPVEGEPECADNYDDTFNAGCPTLYTCVTIACVDSNGCPGTACVNNLCVDPACPTGFDCIDNLCSDPAHPAPYNDPPVTQIACGETICGKGGHYGSDIPCDDNDDCILDGDDYGPCVGGPGGVCSVLNSSRDTDWYEVTIPEAMELTWDVYSDFDALTGFVPFDPPGSANCYDMDGAAIDPAAIGGGCNETVVDAAAGTQRMFVAPLFDDADITGDEIACDGSGPVGNEYFATLICTPASTLDAPGDTCETATDLGVSASGYWSGNIDGTEGFEGDDGDCLDPGDDQCPMPCSLNFNSDVDVWYKWTAPSAACRVTFQTCGYDVTDQVNGGTDVPTIVGIWTGACSGLVQYDDQTGTGEPEAPSAGCGGGDPGYMGSWPTCTGPEDESCPEALTCTAIGGGNYECRYGGNRHCETSLARVTFDAVADQDYYIQVLTDGGQYGLVTLDVSECVDACE